MKLHRQLLVALIAGFALGAVAHGFADSGLIQALGTHVLRPIGQIFLRTIFMIVVPMVFSADETTDVGSDSATPVSDDYGPKDSKFIGRVRWVEIAIDDAAEDLDHLITPEERLRVAMTRQ